jgi:NADPH2:quinone reductase
MEKSVPPDDPRMTQTMTAIAITEPGGPDVLKPMAMAAPQPGQGEVLIRVAAAGVNRPDVLQRQGLYPAPPGASPIPGLEIAGEVIACGPGANRLAIGDRVCALVNGGGYAQFCVSPEATALPIPAGMGLVEAAALPETAFTVWSNVFDRGALRPGEIFLVHGGASGIGTMAIQMARSFGARVFATARGREKCAACERLGAERAIDYETDDFVSVIKSASGGRGADVILDMVGGDYVARNIAAAAEDGRIVQIAFLRGSRIEADLMRLMLKRLTLTGSTLRARPLEAKAQIARALSAHVWPRIEAGEIKPVIDSQFRLSEAGAAHRLMESNAHIGKIMLRVATDDNSPAALD